MHFKKAVISILSLVLCSALYLNAEAKPGIGRIIQLAGDVDLTDENTGIRIVPGVGSDIKENQKIRTGTKAYLEILLNDNTKIFMRDLTIIQLGRLKIKRDDPPTTINFSTGKIRINLSRQFNNWNLVVKTNVAMIGIKNVETDFGVITTNYETKLAIFEGEAHIANVNKDIIKSYNIKQKEETSVKLDMPPTEPVVMPQEILDSWMDYYEVADKNRIVIKGKEDKGPIDYILRKRKF